MGSHCVGWVPRLVPLRGSKLRVASLTGEASGVIYLNPQSQSERGFTQINCDFL
ncbi:MAG: hypothetical protein PUQ00_17570 [Nostoc sp. S13]|nr:hypothetical protein [Nostoc sp. S13]